MTTYSPSSSLDVPATTQSHHSLWRRFIEALMEGRRRKAAGELAEYLRSHKHGLSDEVRTELKRRCMANIAISAAKPALGPDPRACPGPDPGVDAGTRQQTSQRNKAQERPR
jgi:hypothetical protein